METNIENQKPLNLEKQELKKMTWPMVIFFVVSYIVLQIVIGIGLAIMGIANNFSIEDVEELLTSHYFLFIDFVFVLILFMIFKTIRTNVLSMLQLRSLLTFKTWVYIAISMVITFLTSYILFGVLEIQDPTQNPINTFVPAPGLEQLLFFIGVAIVTPIKEEIFFRGVLFRFLEQRHHFIVGLIVSSLVFGVLHPGYMLMAGIMGVIFVLLYKKTKSLAAPIMLHVLWNGLNVVLG
jgi:membrane protease YdiL (CAAX protease family)